MSECESARVWLGGRHTVEQWRKKKYGGAAGKRSRDVSVHSNNRADALGDQVARSSYARVYKLITFITFPISLP